MGLPHESTKSLQMVQNAAARLLLRTRKFDHITPILSSLISSHSFRFHSDGPWALTISGLLLSWNTDRYRLSHPGLHWIITLLCFTISSYLYFCKSWCLSLSITNYLVWHALFQATGVDRSLCGSGTTWWCLVLRSHLLDPLTLHIICITLSVNVSSKLWFVALFCTQDNYCMSVCTGGGIPLLWLFLRFLPSKG